MKEKTTKKTVKKKTKTKVVISSAAKIKKNLILKKKGRSPKVSHCPSKFDPSWMLKKTEDFLAEGHSKVALAAELGIAESTIYVWERTYGDFYEAVQLGLAKCKRWWEDKGRAQFLDGNFNNQVYTLVMNNRFGYANKTENVTETTIKHTGKVKVKNESDPNKLAAVLKILIDAGVFKQPIEEETPTEIN